MAPKKSIDDMTWMELQAKVMSKSVTEAELLSLLEAEKTGRKRSQYLLRLHSRYNVLRGQRERKDLLK
jgi:hypothetical protein